MYLFIATQIYYNLFKSLIIHNSANVSLKYPQPRGLQGSKSIHRSLNKI